MGIGADVQRRLSFLKFAGLRIVPLGCAFVPAFAILFALFVGFLALTGLSESVLAGQIALVAALVGAAVVAIALFQRVIVHWRWYRRLL